MFGYVNILETYLFIYLYKSGVKNRSKQIN
jgi:hypothetical protein